MSIEELTAYPCPHCRATETVYHIEEVEQRRLVLGLDDGVLLVESYAQVLDEDADNERLYCSHCMNEWALPEEVDYR